DSAAVLRRYVAGVAAAGKQRQGKKSGGAKLHGVRVLKRNGSQRHRKPLLWLQAMAYMACIVNEYPPLRVLIAAPRGFCAGVDRAIQIVELALERFGAPVYVRHEIVHNRSSSTGCAASARCSSTSSTRSP